VGTDIHLFVEYRVPDGRYFSLTKGEFELTSNYDAFGALAGVRRDVEPLVEPRGFPDDASLYVRRAYYCLISDLPAHHDGFWRLVKPENVRDYVARGRSHTKSWAKLELVSDPDAHTASWLTASEFEAALAPPSVNDTLREDFRIVLDALQRLAARDARAVFWFDN
jgi:hypothetical protein